MAKRRKRRTTVKQPARELGTLNEVNLNGSPRGSSMMTRFLSSTRRRQRHHGIMPEWGNETSELDKWLYKEFNRDRLGFIQGMVDQASMIHSNRRYTVTGGKRTVNQFLRMLRDAEGGMGFRHLLKGAALDYYITNFGAAIYMQRPNPPTAQQDGDYIVWDLPPVDSIFLTDPTLYQPTTDYEEPWQYNGNPISRFDIFRVVSMPSTAAETYGVGRSAWWRTVHIACFTNRIFDHIMNVIDPDLTKGIVTISGMSPDEAEAALAGMDTDNSMDNAFVGGRDGADDSGDFTVLASADGDISVNFETLSRMPDDLSLPEWLKWALTSVAVNLALPLEEFIGGHASSLLGQSGQEVEAGKERASTKGGGEFCKLFQEALISYVIPAFEDGTPKIDFEFSERDSGAELKDLEIERQKAEILTAVFEARQLVDVGEDERIIDAERRSPGIIDADEARRWGVEMGLLPEWITQDIEEDVSTDDGTLHRHVGGRRLTLLREHARESLPVQRAIDMELDEPIVRFESWTDDNGFNHDTEIELWPSAKDAAGQRVWQLDQTMMQDRKQQRIAAPVRLRKSDQRERRPILRAVSDMLESDEFADLREYMNDIITTQYDGVDVDAVVRDADAEEIPLDDTQAITEIVERNTPSAMEGADQDNLIALLLAISALAANQARDDAAVANRVLTDGQSDTVSGRVQRWIGKRTANLLGFQSSARNMTFGGFPTFLDDTIDSASYSNIAGAFGEPFDTPSAFNQLLNRRAIARSDLIAENEAVAAFGMTHHEGLNILRPTHKQWLETISQNPRPEHLDTVGEIVEWDGTFSNGLTYAPGQVIRCQCGIQPIWR